MSRVLKRPKLENLDCVADELIIESKEKLESNSLYPDIEERLSLWHESAVKRKTEEEHGSGSSLQDPIQGLIELGESEGPSGMRNPDEFLMSDHLESTLQTPDEFAGRTHESDLVMPDNIMAEDQLVSKDVF
ncbi:MAG: hypothetical protein GY696_33290 [Gammaproteobacteria bacterium]|nr:hypothetical protein [Gammaproteobacteria bacterium]